MRSMVEGPTRFAPWPLRQRFALPPPHAFGAGRNCELDFTPTPLKFPALIRGRQSWDARSLGPRWSPARSTYCSPRFSAWCAATPRQTCCASSPPGPSRKRPNGAQPDAWLGLATHFALMAIMATVFVLVAQTPSRSHRQANPMGRDLRPHHLCRHEPDRRAAALPRRLAAQADRRSPHNCSPTSSWSASPSP